jgi:hypothetical protein
VFILESVKANGHLISPAVSVPLRTISIFLHQGNPENEYRKSGKTTL